MESQKESKESIIGEYRYQVVYRHQFTCSLADNRFRCTWPSYQKIWNPHRFSCYLSEPAFTFNWFYPENYWFEIQRIFRWVLFFLTLLWMFSLIQNWSNRFNREPSTTDGTVISNRVPLPNKRRNDPLWFDASARWSRTGCLCPARPFP